MSLPPVPRGWTLAIAVIAVAVFGLYRYGVHQGKLAQQEADAKQREVALVDTVRVYDSLFVHDTVKLTVVRHRTDSVLRVDTLLRADTVRQLVQAERAACDTVIQSCAARIQARDSLNANLRLQIKLLEKQHPSRFTCVLGGAATNKGLGLGGACGVRLF